MPKVLTLDDEPVAEPAFRTLAWIDGSLNDSELAERLGQAYDVFSEVFGGDVGVIGMRDGDRRLAPKEVTTRLLNDGRKWFRTGRKEFAATLRLFRYPTEDFNAPRVPSFRVDEHDGCVLLETSIPDENVGTFADDLAHVLQELPLLSAVQGMGFAVPISFESLITRFPRTTMRYRTAIEFFVSDAIDGVRVERSPFPWSQFPDISPGIPDIGWRTFVGESFLERTPGLNEIDHEGVAVDVREKVVVLTAGEEPIWGDVNAGEDISPYQAVAAALRPIRYPSEVAYRSLFGDLSDDASGRDRIDAYLGRYD
ncbi:MAG: type VI immunity family protein [Planctomycetota bacterium]